MRILLQAALSYFGLVFVAAFLLGVMRVMLFAPWIGAFASVAIEVPLILGLAWLVARRVLKRWPLALAGRLGMGGLAFVFLMLAEFALAFILAGQPPFAYAASFAQPSGALGLAGQIGFALIPAYALTLKVEPAQPTGQRSLRPPEPPRR